MNKQMVRKSLFVMMVLLLVASVGVSIAIPSAANASSRQGNYISDGTYIASSNPTGMQLVQAMSTPAFYATVTSAQYEGSPTQKAIFTQSVQGFPLQGGSFTLLSTGMAADAPGTASYFASTGTGGAFKANWGPYGLDAYDLATLSFTLQVPNDASILSFLYRYGTEESPTWLGTEFKDYFRIMADVPEKGVCALFQLLPDGSYQVHIDNAAAYSNVPGGSSINPEPPLPEPNDTVYNAVTGLQMVELDVSAFRGMEMTLVIEIADVSDPIYDTAVFLDGFEFKSDEPYVVSQPILNAIANLNHTSGYVTWYDETEYGIWADSTYTYCARFTRMCFGEFTAKFATAIEMYEHFSKLKLIKTDTNPPRGAVVFYDRHSENGNCGHVGISDGSGNLYSVVNRANGVLLRSIFGTTFKATYLGYVTAAEFKSNHLAGSLFGVKLASPGSLRVYDSAGRVTGSVDGEILAEIPGSSYDATTNTVTIIPSLEDYHIEVHGEEEGTYTLMIIRYAGGEIVDLDVRDVDIAPGEIHQYDISWTDLAEGKKGITITIGDETINTSKPTVPGAPFPTDGAVDVAVDTALSWEAGDQVDTSKEIYYEIHLGTDPFTLDLEEVIGPFPATQSQVSYQPKGNPGHLDYNTTYYWQILAVDEFRIASHGPVWSFTTITAIPAAIVVDPETLNIKVNSRFVTAYIELPTGYNVSQIDISSIRLNGTVSALTKPTAIGDYDSDGTRDLMIKFDASAVRSLLTPGNQVEITITGEVAGIPFEGTDTIRVIDPTWYSVDISSTAGGSVTVPGEGTFSYKGGTVVSLVATPLSSCYEFAYWTGDVGTIANVTAASTTITMNTNCSITANFEEEVLTFPDPNLEAAIREAIGKPTGDIYPSDLDGLTYLNASERSISNLTGLECCTSLTCLYLGDNQISDISHLANLTNLTNLYLYYDQISDISPLANLTNLAWLDLSWNQVSDLAPLQNLADLAVLNLAANQISDISPLESLTCLSGLALQLNQISNISPLANLTNLTDLSLNWNQISDLSPLVDNPGLGEGDWVGLSGNPLTDHSINICIPELRGVEPRVIDPTR